MADDPTPTDPAATTDPPKDPPQDLPDDGLSDAGRRAIREERSARREAERRAPWLTTTSSRAPTHRRSSPSRCRRRCSTTCSRSLRRSTCSPRIPVSDQPDPVARHLALPAAYVRQRRHRSQADDRGQLGEQVHQRRGARGDRPDPRGRPRRHAFDVWGSVQPLLEKAIGRALDAAVLFGVNKPASWPTDINTAAVAAGNTRVRGTANAAARRHRGGLQPALREGRGRRVLRRRRRREDAYKSLLRGARDANGQALADLAGGTLFGEPLQIVAPGLWPTGGAGGTNAEAFALDASQFVLGVRQDFTYKMLDQAVITGRRRHDPVQPGPAGHGRAARRVPRRLAGREHHQLRGRERRDAVPGRRHALLDDKARQAAQERAADISAEIGGGGRTG
jgi:hypothetical protein